MCINICNSVHLRFVHMHAILLCPQLHVFPSHINALWRECVCGLPRDRLGPPLKAWAAFLPTAPGRRMSMGSIVPCRGEETWERRGSTSEHAWLISGCYGNLKGTEKYCQHSVQQRSRSCHYLCKCKHIMLTLDTPYQIKVKCRLFPPILSCEV